MSNSTRTESALRSRNTQSHGKGHHRLPLCTATGLPRYRDRHQARQGAEALSAGAVKHRAIPFACPDCRGFHLEQHVALRVANAPSGLDTATDRRRYVLVDVENLTWGASMSADKLSHLWDHDIVPTVAVSTNDHIVIGASRSVTRKYRRAIQGSNVKWVMGANAHDAADHALLAAVDLYAVARRFDELVIMSGDHAFAPLARRARALGITVHVVTTKHPLHWKTLSRKLAEYATVRTVVRDSSALHVRAAFTAVA